MKKQNMCVDFEGMFRGRRQGKRFTGSIRYLRKLADANRPKRSRRERPPEPKTRRSRAEIKEDGKL